MRIAYIAPYQGSELVKRRPIVRNLSLGGRVKVELVAELLQRSGHDVEIISQGEVIERRFKVYPGFTDPKLFHEKIPVFYSSAFPVRFLNGLWSSLSTLRIFKARHRISPYDVVLIYNLKPPQVICAQYAIRRLGLPVILEYEDDLFLPIAENKGNQLTSRVYLSAAKRLLDSISGCLACSPNLLLQVTRDVPKLVLYGVVSEGPLSVTEQPKADRPKRVVFSGTHSKPQGLEQLIKGWKIAELADWELHIAGHGQMTPTLHNLADNNPSIVFHGVLDRNANTRLLGTGEIAVVPYDISQTRGFSFKTIECLGAGLHVITTPLGALEALDPEMKIGITYINDNSPHTIAACLKKVIAEVRYEQTAKQATLERYGSAAVSRSLDAFLKQIR